jgi:hypothetical protein
MVAVAKVFSLERYNSVTQFTFYPQADNQNLVISSTVGPVGQDHHYY